METVDIYQPGQPHNVDDILNAPAQPSENLIAPVVQEQQDADLNISRLDSDTEVPSAPEPEVAAQTEPQPEPDTDVYGNKVEKKEKLYTQAEVQEMMRDRNRRGEFARQQQQAQPEAPPVQQPGQSDSDWQVELEQFVERTLEKREQKISHQQWQQQEHQKQQDFEARFNSGAAKYSDFEREVTTKPITAEMMMATRGMEDPAAFLYAAAKLQPKELERISKITDPYQVAAEVGRLDEKMRRATKMTQAPAALAQTRSDSTQVTEVPRSAARIDDLIQKDAQRKYSRYL